MRAAMPRHAASWLIWRRRAADTPDMPPALKAPAEELASYALRQKPFLPAYTLPLADVLRCQPAIY